MFLLLLLKKANRPVTISGEIQRQIVFLYRACLSSFTVIVPFYAVSLLYKIKQI